MLLTIIMPPPSPAAAAPDSSQSIIRQVFTPHTHRSCPATGHGRPSDIKHGDCVLTDQPCSQLQLWLCTTHHHLSSNMGFTIIPYLKTRRLSLYIHCCTQFRGCNISPLIHTYSQLDTGPMLGVWRIASGGGTWSHSVRSRAAAERKIGADQRPATLAVFTDSRYVNK